MAGLAARIGRSQNVRLTLGVLIGLTFGGLMSQIPAPHDQNVFWVGNLCAPWLVIAFCAGQSQSTARRAAVAGLLSETACVVGFYFSFLLHGPTALGLPEGTPLQDYVLPTVTGWLRFISFWLVVAVAAGTVYGLLGHWWRRSATVIAGLAIGLPFLAEPGLWTLRDQQYKGPWTVWAAEAMLGLVLLGIMWFKGAEAWAAARHPTARAGWRHGSRLTRRRRVH